MHNKAASIRNGIRCNGICILVNNFKIYYTKTSTGADHQVKKCHAYENKKLKKIKRERITAIVVMDIFPVYGFICNFIM